jgi:hypothetical protein
MPVKLPAVLLALWLVPGVAIAQTGDPIAGAWERLSMKNVKTGEMVRFVPPPMHIIYSDGQFVFFQANGGRPRLQKPRDEMTKEELWERSNLAGQYGTYRISGNKLMLNVVSAADPLNEGLEITQEFRVDGDSLVVIGTNTRGETYETRFRRLRRTD